MKARLVNWVPLYVMTLTGTQTQHINPFKKLMADCAVTFLTGSTSGDFVQEFKAPDSMGEGAQDVEPLDPKGP